MQASQTLNINYSSAKAILASHRKHLHPPKKGNKGALLADFRPLTPFDSFMGGFAVICSTGGLETSSFDQFYKNKPLFVSSIAPVILLRTEKDLDCSLNT